MPHEAPTFEARMQRIERLVDQIERSTDAKARDAAREVIGTLLELHAEGLKTLFSLIAKSHHHPELLDICVNDDLVRSLMLLHDLHPASLEQRVHQALEKVRPYLRSHGGNVELIEASPAGIRLRMEGSCHGCPSSSATLRSIIDGAMCEFAPDVATIEVEGLSSLAEQAGLVSLQLPLSENGSTQRSSTGPDTRPRSGPGVEEIMHQNTTLET